MYQLIFAVSAKKLNVKREEVLVGLKVLICGRGCVKGRGETPGSALSLKAKALSGNAFFDCH